MSSSLPTPLTTTTTSSVFADLLSAHPTWSELRAFLESETGGSLSVYEVPDSGVLAMIRYVKGTSNMDLSHVGAFRSVVWNTESNRPVSVTAWKSERGESLPDMTGLSINDIRVENFVDGVMIGQFFDVSTGTWRIHTRSTLDANCRYYSKTHTFAQLFDQVAATEDLAVRLAQVPKNVALTWILSHPENRIVCPVQKPSLSLVACVHVDPETGTVTQEVVPDVLKSFQPVRLATATGYASIVRNIATDVPALLHATVGLCGTMTTQGVVVTVAGQPFRRWKLRSSVYNTVRRLRGNSARLDFLWMALWSRGALEEYLKFYPEERRDAQAVVDRWKEVTQTTYNCYVDVFKARSSPRDAIPAKIKPLVLGLHQEYLNVLRPAKKSLDWRAAVQYMNARDTAQKIYVLNWDLRQEAQHRRDMREAAQAAQEIPAPIEPNA